MSWVLLDAGEFAKFADLSSSRWKAIVDGVLFHTSIGPAVVTSVLTSPTSKRSSLKVLFLPTAISDWRFATETTILDYAFTVGDVTEILVPAAAIENSELGFPQGLALSPTELSPSQNSRSRALRSTADSFAEMRREIERERDVRLEKWRLAETRRRERELNEREAAQKRAEEQRTRRIAGIREICERRRIARLMHFTRLRSLAPILERGLLPRSELSRLAHAREIGPVQLNDDLRLDRQPDALCLTISFPNYLLFNSFRIRKNEPWVVLTLAPSLLWELDCAFCITNAADSSVTCVPLDVRRQPPALEAMFAELPDGPRTAYGLPDSYSTNPQAEVLVLSPIPPSYITGVCFESTGTLEEWTSSNGKPADKPFSYESPLFSYRQDWKRWKKIDEDRETCR